MKYKLVFVQSVNGVPEKFRGAGHRIVPYLTRTGQIYTGHTDAEAEAMAAKLGLAKDALYAPSYPYRPNDTRGQYWNTFSVRLDNDGLLIDTDTPFGELIHRFLSRHHHVATGAVTGHHRYRLIDLEEESKKKVSGARRKLEAMNLFHKMEFEDIRRAITVCSISVERGASQVAMEAALIEFIERDADKFMLLWGENPDRLHQSFIEDCVKHNLIRKEASRYYINNDMIAGTMTDAIAWKKDPANQDIVASFARQMLEKEGGYTPEPPKVEPDSKAKLVGAALAAKQKAEQKRNEINNS